LPHASSSSTGASIRAAGSMQNAGWNCMGNSPERSLLCAPDNCQNSTWTCCWIDPCTSDIPVVEEPSTPSVPEPAPESTPAACTSGGPSGTQYQLGSGQYQPPVVPEGDLAGDCAHGALVVSPAAPVSSPPTALAGAAGVGSGQVATVTRAPIVAPGPPEVVPETPPPPDRQPTPATATGTGPKSTSVSSSPPLASAGEVVGETVSPREPLRTLRTHTPVAHPKRQVPPAKIGAQTTARTRGTAAPPTVALEAPAEPAAAGRGAPLSDWLLFAFAAFLALGLSSFAVVAWSRPDLPALSALRSRIGSRGLSANTRGTAPSRGIRYRDP
jgi:hypothetical protein